MYAIQSYQWTTRITLSVIIWFVLSSSIQIYRSQTKYQNKNSTDCLLDRSSSLKPPTNVYAESSEESKKAINFDKDRENIKTCLKKLICQMNSNNLDAKMMTALMKSPLSLFMKINLLGKTSSRMYPYQIAAHLGQLGEGFEPSICESFYTECPFNPEYLLPMFTT